jgi:hypothetical protein
MFVDLNFRFIAEGGMCLHIGERIVASLCALRIE